jgi:hypothetical protein
LAGTRKVPQNINPYHSPKNQIDDIVLEMQIATKYKYLNALMRSEADDVRNIIKKVL